MSKRYTTETFIKEAKEKWQLNLDYSKVDYENSKSPITLKCLKHNIEFLVLPTKHLSRGDGCPKCRYEKTSKNNPSKKSTEQFIEEAKKIHNKYDYSLTNYINAKTKVEIICPIHGSFFQEPRHHLQGVGCPYCFESKGEKEIQRILEENGLILNKDFYREQKFKDLGKLRFDFYIPSKNLLIEYQGTQHYEYAFSDTHKSFLKRKHHDWLKREYAKNHQIRLLTISYKDSKILKNILGETLL